jgi:hypothetical protein
VLQVFHNVTISGSCLGPSAMCLNWGSTNRPGAAPCARCMSGCDGMMHVCCCQCFSYSFTHSYVTLALCWCAGMIVTATGTGTMAGGTTGTETGGAATEAGRGFPQGTSLQQQEGVFTVAGTLSHAC